MKSLWTVALLFISYICAVFAHSAVREADKPAVENSAFQELLNTIHDDAIHAVIHSVSDKFRHGAFESDSNAIKAVHQEDAQLASRLLTLVKRSNATGSLSASTTTPSIPVETSTVVTTDTTVQGSTVTTTETSTIQSTTSLSSTPPPTTSSPPPTSSSSTTSSTTSSPTPTPTSTTTPSTTPSSTPTTLSTSTPSSSFVPTTTSSTSSSPLSTSTVRKTTTLPDGSVSTVTAITLVTPTQTTPTGASTTGGGAASLQSGDASPSPKAIKNMLVGLGAAAVVALVL